MKLKACVAIGICVGASLTYAQSELKEDPATTGYAEVPREIRLRLEGFPGKASGFRYPIQRLKVEAPRTAKDGSKVIGIREHHFAPVENGILRESIVSEVGNDILIVEKRISLLGFTTLAETSESLIKSRLNAGGLITAVRGWLILYRLSIPHNITVNTKNEIKKMEGNLAELFDLNPDTRLRLNLAWQYTLFTRSETSLATYNLKPRVVSSEQFRECTMESIASASDIHSSLRGGAFGMNCNITLAGDNKRTENFVYLQDSGIFFLLKSTNGRTTVEYRITEVDYHP